MISAILHVLVAIAIIVISGWMLFLTLKRGEVVGRIWQGTMIFKKEQPVRYWCFVVCYAAIFVVALWLLIQAGHNMNLTWSNTTLEPTGRMLLAVTAVRFGGCMLSHRGSALRR